jgi:hypothetical protein
MGKIDFSAGFGGVPVNVIVTRFTQITGKELGVLSISDQLELIKTVFLPYILNGFTDEGITVPPEFSEVWARCKAIIEKEVGR